MIRRKYRYTAVQKFYKWSYRLFNPIPKSPWTAGKIDDICAVNLVPPSDLEAFFAEAIDTLIAEKGEDIGDYLEFGVFNGSSISSFYNALKSKAKARTRLFGFDAFEGLPKGSEDEDDGVWRAGFYACSFQKMKECLERRGVCPDHINWVKGWYSKTLTPGLISKHSITNLGIVFIDCDTYSSSKAVLDFIAPLIKSPCIVCLDDWKLNDLDIKGMGEYQSFNEFLEENEHIYAIEIKSYNRKSKSFLLRRI